MFNKNHVTLIGHVGQDPEVRDTQGGKKVASLTLYTSRTWKDAEGKRQERNERHRLTAFRPGLVKVLQEHVKKGTFLNIEGSLHYGSYEDGDVTRYTTEIIVETLGFLSPKPASDSDEGTGHPDGYPEGSGDLDDEIPF